MNPIAEAARRRHLLAEIAPDRPVEPMLQPLLDDYADRLETALPAFALVPGVAAFIRSRTFAIFVCSAAPDAEIRRILTHHDLLGAVIEIHDGARIKAEALRLIAETYPGRCLFVGDAAADLHAARQAGIPFVLRRGYAFEPAVAAKADALIDHFHGVETIVRSLLD